MTVLISSNVCNSAEPFSGHSSAVLGRGCTLKSPVCVFAGSDLIGLACDLC